VSLNTRPYFKKAPFPRCGSEHRAGTTGGLVDTDLLTGRRGWQTCSTLRGRPSDWGTKFDQAVAMLLA
jgi:hypothetical protein